jgi:hypothetical protein
MADTVIGTRRTVFYLDSIDFTSEVSQVTLVAGKQDSGFMSFAQALAGGARKYTLKVKLRQNTAATSLWYYIWNELGADNTFEFWPNGYNSGTPSATYPQFSGTVVVTEPDGDLLGGEANESANAVNVVEVEWECTAKPTLAITGD